ncbi:MAG: hypothetical protein ABF703_08020 [Oenococcus sp.]|uniref:hypothetical protein n=1 Tax=Oenococcus TaxID=46254 RepID=UPI0021E82D22|nr:hypothetical protein [Oenococcus kitaharae]MCV3296899.1 hypothetical protein [Oenococcus kitaharae]
MTRAKVLSHVAEISFFKSWFFCIDLAFIVVYVTLFVISMFLGVQQQTLAYDRQFDAQRSTIGGAMYGVAKQINDNPEMPKKQLAYLRHGLELAANVSNAIKKQENALNNRQGNYLPLTIQVSRQADILNQSQGPIQASDADIFRANAAEARRLMKAHMSFEFNDASFNFPNVFFLFTSYFFNPLSILLFLVIQLAFFLLEKERKNERLLQTLADEKSLALGKMLFALKRFITDLLVIYILASSTFLILDHPLLKSGSSSFAYPMTFLGMTQPLIKLLWPLFVIGLLLALLVNALLPLIYQKAVNRPLPKGMRL